MAWKLCPTQAPQFYHRIAQHPVDDDSISSTLSRFPAHSGIAWCKLAHFPLDIFFFAFLFCFAEILCTQVSQINATWPEKCIQPGITRCNLEHNHRLSGPLRAGRQDPVLPEELLPEHVSALKEWARIPVAVRTQVGVRSPIFPCQW